MSRKFPTKKEFIQWWDNKEDVWIMMERAKTCPFARYFKEKSNIDIAIGSSTYRSGLRSYELPIWATVLIRAFDLQHHPHKGLPDGYKQ